MTRWRWFRDFFFRETPIPTLAKDARCAIAAFWHHKPLADIVHHLGLAFLDEGFASRLVTYIDALAGQI